MKLLQNFITKLTGKKMVFSIVAAFAFICATAAPVDNANLAGKWTLNESKSDLGQYGARMASKTINVEQTAQDISFGKTSSAGGEERTTTEKLSFDGKETESTAFNNSKKKSTTKWVDDGKTLMVTSTIAFEMNGETTEIKSTETYKLSDDGKTLTIESKSTSPRGDNTMKLVYEKA